MTDETIHVIIPALNEAESLPHVLKGIPPFVGGRAVHVTVVDDGSTDGTGETALSHGVKVLTHDRPLGGGRSIKDGIEAVVGAGASFVVTMDADGQHLPEDLEVLAAPILADELDLVNGSRLLGEHDRGPLMRQVGIVMFSRLASLLMWQRVTDLSSGYRMFRADCATAVCPRQPQFHAPDTYIRAWRRGFRVGEVPVSVHPRLHGRSKKPGSLKYGWGFMRSILRARFGPI